MSEGFRPDRPSAGSKKTPYSEEAEQAVLGSLLLDTQAWDRVSDILQVEDFYSPQHRFIYSAIMRLITQHRAIDVLTVFQSLKDSGQLDGAGGEAYLYELAQNTPSAANVTAYADIIREKSILRQMIQAGTDIVTQAYDRPDGNAIHELLDQAERQIFKISQDREKNNGPEELTPLLARAMERIDMLSQQKGSLTGQTTGFVDFDRLTTGLQESDLIVLAGRPSMGKTILGVNIAEAAAMGAKYPALVFSLEMPADAIAMRLISSLGMVDQHKVRTGQLNDDDWQRVTAAVGQLSEAKLYIDDTPSLSPTELRSRARRIVREHGGISVIVVDYLQLMKIGGHQDNRAIEISEISRSLKALAKELSVPVVALSQLNRSLEQRVDKRPVMSDLRESGAIEQDADLIVFIYRDEVYHEETADKGIAEIIIAKHRNGPIGKIRLRFNGAHMRFESLAFSQDKMSDDLSMQDFVS